MSAIPISVIVCTYNRSRYLRRAIDSLAKQQGNPSEFEVVIVDNHSTDDTAAVVDQAITAHPGIQIRYIFEAAQGLSIARNRGIQESHGEVVAFLDDDAYAEPQWLSVIVTAFRQLQPAPVCVGGRVYLDWEGSPSDWLPRRYRSLYTYLDHGDQTLLLNNESANRYLQGANMAFRRDLFTGKGMSFSEALGRKGTTLLSGEDSAIINSLLASNAPVFYVPDAAVWHVVLPDRRTRRYLLRRIIGDGATQPLMDIQSGNLTERALFRRLLYDVKCCLMSLLQAALSYAGRRADAAEPFFAAMRYYGRSKTELGLLLGLAFRRRPVV